MYLGLIEKYRWLYERLWTAARECNRLFFCVDLGGVESELQLARYDSTDQGFYGWHTDFSGARPLRKLSITIQLSNSEDYEGGDLELLYDKEPYKLDRSRGTFLVFPSFMTAPRDAGDPRHALEPRCVDRREALAVSAAPPPCSRRS